MAWDFLQRGIFSPYIDEALRDNGGIVLKIEMQPRAVNVTHLNMEVVRSLQAFIESDFSNIAEKFLYDISDKPSLLSIVENTKCLLDCCNAIVLPGGEHIESELYTRVTGFSRSLDPLDWIGNRWAVPSFLCFKFAYGVMHFLRTTYSDELWWFPNLCELVVKK